MLYKLQYLYCSLDTIYVSIKGHAFSNAKLLENSKNFEIHFTKNNIFLSNQWGAWGSEIFE